MDYKIVVQDQLLDKTYDLDLFSDIDVNVIYNLVDIREPERRKTNHTKEITIPATPTNNLVFAGLIENGFSVTSFNPNFKLNAVLYRNEQPVIEGYLQVLEVIKNENNVDAYKIIIYGEIFTFFKDIEGYNLNDLDLSEFNHAYTKTNIKNSWTAEKGEGYVYPMEWRGKTDEDYDVEDFLPAIYVKQFIDSIFELSPMTYKSDFLSSDYFKSLIIPNTKDRMYLSEEEKATLEFTAFRNSDERRFDYDAEFDNLGKSFTKGIRFNDEVDPGNIFSPSFYYRPVRKGETTLTADLNLRLRYRIRPGIADGIYKVYNQEFTSVDISIVRKRNGVNTVIGSENYEFLFTDNSITVTSGVGVLEIEEDFITQVETLVKPGDSYWVNVRLNIPGNPDLGSLFFNFLGQSVGGDLELEIMQGSEFYNAASDFLYEEGTVKMNQILPSDVTCTDFITSINKLFNLYWVPIDDKTIRIEPRDNLYNGDDVEVIDWTDKVDRNSEMIITPLSELNHNKYLFKYEEDSDHYNTRYVDTNNEEYGQREVRVLNDFVNETYELDTIFSQSPMVNLNNTDMVTPAIVELGDGGFFERFSSPNIRIHYWGGLKTTDFGWTFNTTAEKPEEQIYYPYAGHVNDPYSPTEDLLFDMPRVLYWDWEKYTQNNLYYKFWEDTILDLTDKESHLLKCTIKHNDLDINNLNLFDTIQVDEVYYVVNSIDYNPSTNISEVELFKKSTFLTVDQKVANDTVEPGDLKEKEDTLEEQEEAKELKDLKKNDDPYDWKDKVEEKKRKTEELKEEKAKELKTRDERIKEKVDKERRLIATRDDLGTYKKKQEKRNITNVHKNFGATKTNNERFVSVRGRDNNVGKTVYNIQVNGDNNSVPGNNRNIQINGSNNTVAPGVNNVTIVGDNQYITSSNVIVIDGLEVSDNLQFNYGVNYYNGSIDEVQNPFGNQNDVTNIVCGIDAVQNIGTSSPVNFIFGGIDTNGNPDYTDLS